MRLADFIVKNREPILVEWEAFARTCKPASGSMDITALRDHANEMLGVIAMDLQQPQGRQEQEDKSQGNATEPASSAPTAAEHHGADRAESGFTVEQMISEYRALRATVIRLWTVQQGVLAPADVEDLTRFNEAIDQALAESVTRYTEDLGHSKEMFLAILGHDLRTPIGAIKTAATFMLETKELKEPHLTLTTRIASSSIRMNRLVGDLLDFTRSRLGGGIPIVREDVDVGKMVHDVVEEILVAYPEGTINIDARGSEHAQWDCPRMTQALSNLLSNAIEHGASRSPVSISIAGEENEVAICIHNHGAAIPAVELNGIFNPMKRGAAVGKTSSGPTGNLGLGLYIADRIVAAHMGRIEVESSEQQGTVFTVHVPRVGAPATA